MFTGKGFYKRTKKSPRGALEFGILKKDYKIAISKEIIFY
jgi:hypothetical protein